MTNNFDEADFWRKIKVLAMKAGTEVIEKALCLYYATKEAETPSWAKTVIYGALAYFILPVDAIPDAIPAVGYTDDLGVLVAAIVTISMYITDDVKNKAAKKMSEWFNL